MVEHCASVHATPIFVMDPGADPGVALNGIEDGIGLANTVGATIFNDALTPFGENLPVGSDLVLPAASWPVPEASSFLLFGSGLMLAGLIVRINRRR
jgi:PEP-CTERM motif-containing protein